MACSPEKVQRLVLGAPRDPLQRGQRQGMLLGGLSCLDRAWRGRTFFGQLRSRGDFSGAGRPQSPGPLPGARNGHHRRHHLPWLCPGHRAVSLGRRRVSRRFGARWALCRTCLRLGAHRQLCPDGRALGCQRRRCAVQLAADRLATMESAGRDCRDHLPHHRKSARHQGGAAAADADLRGVSCDPRRPHRRRHLRPRRHIAQSGARHLERDLEPGLLDRLDGGCRHRSAGICAGRRLPIPASRQCRTTSTCCETRARSRAAGP